MTQSIQLASLCYVMKENQILMLHRNKDPNDVHKGKWNGLGGKFCPGETSEECVIREVFEESGLHVKAPEFLGILTFPNFTPDTDWCVFLFRSFDFDGEVKENHEGTLSWVDKEELFDLNLWPGDKIFLPYVLEGKNICARFVYRDGQLESYQIEDGPSFLVA